MRCRAHVTTPVLNCLSCQGLTLPKSHKARNPLAVQRSAIERAAVQKIATTRAVPLEHEEQAEVFAWTARPDVLAELPELAELFAVPNFSGRLGNTPPVAAIRQAEKLNREGRKKGVEDVMLLAARGGYHGWLGEMKRVNGTASDVSPEQVAWHMVHVKRGYCVVVCYGAEHMKNELRTYLSLPVTKVKHA